MADAHLMAADATALQEHLVSHGVRIVKGLRDADYGAARLRHGRPRRQPHRRRPATASVT
jgi:hypothetical protein